MYFNDSGAYGVSVVKGGEAGYIPALLNDGFKDKSHKEPSFFGYEGFNFMELALEQARKDPRFKNLVIELNKDSPY